MFNEKPAFAGIEQLVSETNLVRKPTMCCLTRSGTRIKYLMNAKHEFSTKAHLDT